MRKWAGFWALLLVVTVVLFGCPATQLASDQYTSADVTNAAYSGCSASPTYNLGGLDGAPTASPEDTAGDGETATREVIEPDVIRRQDNLLFVLNQYRGLTILDLASREVLSQLPTFGVPRDLYLAGGKAYVLVSQAPEYTTSGVTVDYTTSSRIYAVDIANPRKPAILSQLNIIGDLLDSRLVGSILYAVTTDQATYAFEDGGSVTVSTPAVKQDSGSSKSWITSVNAANPGNLQAVETLSFEGVGNIIHVTDHACFVAGTTNGFSSNSRIQYVDISNPSGDMALRGAVDIEGTVADRFKMDSYNGVLRVVSHGWTDTRKTFLTTINEANPDTLAALARIELTQAQGDTLFATRFDGDRAYLVTYFIEDPLFVVDLSNPSAPIVAGELHVPGWSTHIEPRGDRLVALGVDDTNGRRVCLSLFNVANPAAPSLVKRVTFGENWSWSSAYSDVKSFTVADDLCIVPFSGDAGYAGGSERLQFVTWSPDDLLVRGIVDLQGASVRSFEYEGMAYGLSTEQLAAIDIANLDSPVVVHRLDLADNVVDYLPLAGGTSAEIVSRLDSGVTSVYVQNAQGQRAGQVDVNIGSFSQAFVWDRFAILVGQEWPTDYSSTSQRFVVAKVDCANPIAPTISGRIVVNVQPWWGYYYPLFDGVDGAEPAAIKQYWPIWRSSNLEDSTFLLGENLAIRCTADSYGVTLGTASPSQGIAVVNLATLSHTKTIGLGYDRVEAIAQAGAQLAVGVAEPAGSTPVLEQPLIANKTALLDVATPAIGEFASAPGRFTSYDEASGVYVFWDQQWGADWSVSNKLHTARWESSAITILDTKPLPDSVSRIIVRGGKIFTDAYASAYRVTCHTIGGNGVMTAAGEVLVSSKYGYLIDAVDSSAFIAVGSGALCRYSFGATPTLDKLREVMAVPGSIRAGTNLIYAPLGYYGLLTMPR